MKVTIKQIADMAGVSRGTVDRVIHNRYGVDPAVKSRVQEILKQVDYKPNAIAQSLKYSEKPMYLGFVITDIQNPFWQGIVDGFLDAEKQFEPHGVKLIRKDMQEISPAEQIRCLDELRSEEETLGGVFIAGINSPLIVDYINDLPDSLPIMTYNTDINGTNRLCFVGQNHLEAGRVAGKMMSLLMRREGEIASFVGTRSTLAHEERFSGFCESMKLLRPDTDILEPIYHFSNNEAAYESAVEILKRPKLAALYVTGEGNIGVAQALAESGRRPDVKMICYDSMDGVVDAIKRDIVDVTIGQNEYLQGYLPVKLMYEYLTFGRQPPTEKIFTDIDIRVKENIDYRSNNPDSTYGPDRVLFL